MFSNTVVLTTPPALQRSALVEQFVEKDTGGDRRIDRITSANHRDTDDEIASFRELIGQPVFFASNQERSGHRQRKAL